MSAEYFKIDTNSRAPFQYGICLYLCWGTMIIYGVGASLYTFSGKSIRLRPKMDGQIPNTLPCQILNRII